MIAVEEMPHCYDNYKSKSQQLSKSYRFASFCPSPTETRDLLVTQHRVRIPGALAESESVVSTNTGIHMANHICLDCYLCCRR